MKRAILAAAASLPLAFPAAALDRPAPIEPGEPHMRRQVYNPYGRTLVVGNPTRSTVIVFAPDENIKRVVQGDEKIWSMPTPEEVQQSPLGNILPLWANTPGRTTLQVITQKPGHPDRPYQFSAVVRSIPPVCDKDGRPAADGIHMCDDDPEAIYGLVFAYPDDERRRQTAQTAETRAQAQTRRAAEREQRDRATAVARLQTDFICVNGLYDGIPMKNGDRSLAPDDVCDDGQSIGLLYKGARPVPSVFLVDPDGTNPRSIRTTQRGDWVVVPVLRERIRLMVNDRSALDVVNRAFNPHGHSPGTGTGSPDVVREVVQAPGNTAR